ncbi:PGF-CTERM sorting domain-containing protein [Halobacteria archaeon AArc-curdl1]|uniref:PGF-CTERM sorting domain-containing protein n=1 Tax=Natronosalvus hydrolyticus TaxID=2979988 RepID=A0AAP2ZB85_9EURY|nr:PGF-CTERM sorting domain-containing protein [Halobacteria archaeon AArc-curdl1]
MGDTLRTGVTVAVVVLTALAGIGAGTALGGATAGNASSTQNVEATFDSSTYTQIQGDEVVIEIDLAAGVDQVTLEIGDPDYGYEAEVVASTSSGGTVEIIMDTYRAGGWDGTPASDVYTGGDGTTILEASRSNDLPIPLQPAGDDDDDPGEILLEAYTDDGIQDISSIELLERSTDDIAVLTHPQSESPSGFDDLESTLTVRDVVATGDPAYVGVQATGLSGFLSGADDLATGTEGASLTVVQADAGPYDDPVEIDISDAPFEYDPDAGRFYVGIDTSQAGVEPGEYEATFTLSEENPYVESGEERVETTFEIVDPDITITSESVSATGTTTLEGQSTLAPGTTVDARVVGPTSIERLEGEVRSDGSISIPLGFDDLEAGDELEAELSVGDELVDQRVVPVEDDAVETPGSIEIESVNAPTSIVIDEPFTPAATFTNPGDTAVSDTVFLVTQYGEYPQEIDLEGGETRQVSWDVELEGTGEEPYAIVTPDEYIEDTVTVQEETDGAPAFAIDDLYVPSTVTEGETFTFEATIVNEGSGAGETPVVGVFDGDLVEERVISLESGESQRVTFETTADVSPGVYDIIVGPPGEEVLIGIEVLEADTPADDVDDTDAGVDDVDDTADVVDEADDEEATIEISSVTHPSSHPVEGNTEVTLENHGVEARSVDVSLEFDGELADETDLTLEAGEERTVTLEVPEDLDPGAYEVVVTAGESTHEETLEITADDDGAPAGNVNEELRLGDDVDGQPGFTAIGALVALLSIALLARRR